MYGQASPQPIVTTTSAHSTSASVNPFGRRPEMSTPTSRIAATTGACNSVSGRDPADRASPPSCS